MINVHVHNKPMNVSWLFQEKQRYSGELMHGTCHFYTKYTGVSKIDIVYGNIKD